MTLIKLALNILSRAVCFAFMLLFGVASFNLYYFSEKMQMLQVVNEFHAALINDDKATIDDLLTDDFTETGAQHFVQTPDVINKKDVLSGDHSKINCRVELRFLRANIFGNASDSLFFERRIILIEDGKDVAVNSYLVTYIFEKASNGLKISQIKRNL